MNDNTTLTGILGTTTSFTGFMVSMMPHIETGLRWSSVGTGIPKLGHCQKEHMPSNGAKLTIQLSKKNKTMDIHSLNIYI